jgi:hypothetical protein
MKHLVRSAVIRREEKQHDNQQHRRVRVKSAIHA